MFKTRHYLAAVAGIFCISLVLGALATQPALAWHGTSRVPSHGDLSVEDLVRVKDPVRTGQALQPGLTIVPDALALAPGEASPVLVIATLPFTTVQSVILSAYHEPVVAVEIADAARAAQPLNDNVAWNVLIRRPADGRVTGQVIFRADYVFKNSDGVLVNRVLTAELAVAERVPDPVERVLTATLETTLENIQDQKSRLVHIVVKNISNTPVTVTRIKPYDITASRTITYFGLLPRTVTYFRTNTALLESNYRLEPQQTHPFTFIVEAQDRVEPGKQLLLVQVDAEWEQVGQKAHGTLVLKKEFQAGVFGEAEILAATAIPSLLLLPGFLFVTFGLLLLGWTWKWQPFEINVREPKFWVSAVTVSLLVTFLYPLATGLLAIRIPWLLDSPRDYLLGYGFKDIVYLWLGMVVLALVLWALGSSIVLAGRGSIALASRARAWWEARERAARIPVADDQPLDLLSKLANNDEGFTLERVLYTDQGKTQNVFVLPRKLGAPQGQVWIVPPARVLWGKAERSQRREFVQRLKVSREPRALAERLVAWSAQGVKVCWETSPVGLIEGPQLVDASKTTPIPNSIQPLLI